MSASPKRFWRIEEVADYIAVSTRTVRRWIDEKALPIHRFGRAVRIDDRDLKAFLAASRFCHELRE